MKWKLFALPLAFSTVAWCGLYGPLFPWSPIKPGYQTQSFAHADVSWPAGRALPPAYAQIDDQIAQASRRLRLPQHQRLHVTLAASWSDFRRFLPFYSARPGAICLETGAEIYVTPRLDENGYDHGEFLRHEITHALLRQNAPAWNYHRLADAPWLHEGLPVWVSRPRAFLTQPEFRARAARQPLAPLFETPGPQTDYRFAYIAWRNFLDWLAQRSSEAAVSSYAHAVFLDRAQLDPLFQRTFGLPRPKALHLFEKDLLSGAYQPHD